MCGVEWVEWVVWVVCVDWDGSDRRSREWGREREGEKEREWVEKRSREKGAKERGGEGEGRKRGREGGRGGWRLLSTGVCPTVAAVISLILIISLVIITFDRERFLRRGAHQVCAGRGQQGLIDTIRVVETGERRCPKVKCRPGPLHHNGGKEDRAHERIGDFESHPEVRPVLAVRDGARSPIEVAPDGVSVDVLVPVRFKPIVGRLHARSAEAKPVRVFAQLQVGRHGGPPQTANTRPVDGRLEVVAAALHPVGGARTCPHFVSG